MASKWRTIEPSHGSRITPTDATLVQNAADEISVALLGHRTNPNDHEDMFRLAWSLGTRRATASLFDFEAPTLEDSPDARVHEERLSVSIHHFKKAFCSAYNAVDTIFSKTAPLPNAAECAELVKEMLCLCGHVLARPRRLTSCPYRHCSLASGSDLEFVRGYGPGMHVLMSGAGAFLHSSQARPEGSLQDPSIFFQFSQETPAEFRTSFLADTRWRPHTPAPDEAWEYFVGNFWYSRPSPSTTMARLTTETHRDYFMLKQSGDEWMEAPVPELFKDRISDLRIGNQIVSGKPPKLLFQRLPNGLIQIDLKSWPPQALHYAVLLYSWPHSGELNNKSRRIMNAGIFKMLENEAHRIGYIIEELK